MQIAFDARWYNDSGVGSYVRGLLNAYSCLRAHGVEIVVLEDPRRPVPVARSAGLRKIRVECPKYSLREQLLLPQLCRREGIALFHSPFFVVPWFAGCPVVATLFDLAPFHHQMYGRSKTLIIRQGYRRACRVASRIVTSSQNSAGDIQSILGYPSDRITSIPLAAADAFRANECADGAFLLQLGIRKPYVLLMGAHNWKLKGLNVGLEALTRLPATLRKAIQVVVTGPTDALRQVPCGVLAASLNVVATGYVNEAHLAALYRQASVFLFPSRFEGFGLPVVEAMSCGCAVVCSNTTSLPEVAGDGAMLVDPGDCASFASALEAVLADPSTRERWQARALRRASNFSFDVTARKTLDVYRAVLGVAPESNGELSPQGSQCLEAHSSRA